MSSCAHKLPTVYRQCLSQERGITLQRNPDGKTKKKKKKKKKKKTTKNKHCHADAVYKIL